MADKEQVIEAIKKCYDPEIPVNVYDLGLIYDVDVKEDKVHITMTLTTQMCPSAQQIPEQVKNQIIKDCGVENVEVNLVWEPAWTPESISPAGRKVLHLDDEE